MAVLFMDSANGNDGASRWFGYGVQGILPTASPSGRAAYDIRNNNSHQLLYNYPTPPTDALIGFYGRMTVSLNNDNSADAQLLRFQGPTGTVHMVMTIDSNGAIHGRLGAGNGANQVQSANGVITLDIWHHFEVYCSVNDSGGRFRVMIDGVQAFDFTGDTRNGGSDTTVGAVRVGRNVNGQWHVSDLRISNSATNLGVTTVWMSLPNGNGNTSGMMGSDGNQTDNYLLVDEATPNGDTDYVFSDTEGVFDLYQLSDLPSGTWDVLAVQSTFNTRTSDGGSKFVRPVFRSGGSNATGASQLVPASYLSRMEVFEQNPVGPTAWTQPNFNSLEVGPEVRDS